ncbi:MAG: hypothetical protein U5K72_17515 [Balneolaceae bacterium]|nr:hypothetical protein [Balneolaceae bacterium]
MENLKHREELIRRIKNIEDKDVLDEIYRLLDIDLDESVYELNELQKYEIEQARKELKNGKGIPSNQVNKEIDEWLKK